MAAPGRVAVIVGSLAVALAISGCDSNSGKDAEAAVSTDAAVSSPIEPTEGPTSAPTNTYVVDSGDTLSGIAAGYGLSLDELVEVNDWSEGADHAIFPGDVIGLPEGAVVVSTTRPSTAGSSATTSAAASSGGYTATGQAYVGPALDGATDPIVDPLPDGMYWAFSPRVDGAHETISFELVQRFSGEACREHFGTAPDVCLSDIEFDGATTTAWMDVGSGTVSVLYLHGGMDVEAYRITAEELARLLAGEPPADDAPIDFEFDPVDAFVVTVQNGAVTAAHQIWTS